MIPTHVAGTLAAGTHAVMTRAAGTHAVGIRAVTIHVAKIRAAEIHVARIAAAREVCAARVPTRAANPTPVAAIRIAVAMGTTRVAKVPIHAVT